MDFKNTILITLTFNIGLPIFWTALMRKGRWCSPWSSGYGRKEWFERSFPTGVPEASGWNNFVQTLDKNNIGNIVDLMGGKSLTGVTCLTQELSLTLTEAAKAQVVKRLASWILCMEPVPLKRYLQNYVETLLVLEKILSGDVPCRRYAGIDVRDGQLLLSMYKDGNRWYPGTR